MNLLQIWLLVCLMITRNIIENALLGKTRCCSSFNTQTGEELDLDKKGFFGNNFYSDQFKEDYNRTPEELKKNKKVKNNPQVIQKVILR